MSDSRDEIAEQFLTEAQRDALQDASNVFSAAVITQAGKLLTGELGLSDGEANPILAAITDRVNDMDDVLDMRKTAKRIGQLRRLFGGAPVSHAVQLQAVDLSEQEVGAEEGHIPTAPTDAVLGTTATANPIPEREHLSDLVSKASAPVTTTIWSSAASDAWDEDEVAAVPVPLAEGNNDDQSRPAENGAKDIQENLEPNEPKIKNTLIDERVARFLAVLFGTKFEEKVKTLTTRQTAFLAAQLVPIYEAAPQGKAYVNEKLKKAYAEQFEEVLNGVPQREVAEKHGVKLDTLASNLSSVRSVIKQELSEGEMGIIIDSIPPAEPLDDAPDVHDALDIPAHLPEVIKLVADSLHIDDKRGFLALNRIFNVEDDEAENSLEASSVRKKIRETIEVLSIDELLAETLKLDELEDTVLREILGNGEKPPLAVKRVNGKVNKELKEAKRDIESVLKSGLTKVAVAWERA